jgi:hypothetical protein
MYYPNTLVASLNNLAVYSFVINNLLFYFLT